MEAMILAAGLGTRLKPLTDRIPKALVDVGGLSMLERIARNLIGAGADHLIINLHHHAELIRSFVESRNGFGVDVSFSHEVDTVLDTGGGLKFAAPHFRRDADFMLHNVDVLSEANLRAMYLDHTEHGALATLAVRETDADRYLLVTEMGEFCGFGSIASGDRRCNEFADRGALRRVDFCGIHVLSPRIFALMKETGAFSIIFAYFRLVDAGYSVRTTDVGKAPCLDVGTHEGLAAARHYFSETD